MHYEVLRSFCTARLAIHACQQGIHYLVNPGTSPSSLFSDLREIVALQILQHRFVLACFGLYVQSRDVRRRVFGSVALTTSIQERFASTPM